MKPKEEREKRSSLPNAVPSLSLRYGIGIFLWNSPKYAETEKEFFEFLKKSIEGAGGNAFLYPVSGGIDPSDHEEPIGGQKLSQPFLVSANVSGNGLGRTLLHNYSLPSRDLVADQIEVLVQADHPDGMLMIPWSVSSLVGMLMASVRCGIPTLFFPHYSAFSAFSLIQKEKGKKNVCSEIFYSPRSPALLLEVMGLAKIGTLEEALWEALPKNKTSKKRRVRDWKEPEDSSLLHLTESMRGNIEWNARRIIEMVNQKISPRRFFSTASFHNALAVDLALGGSRETILHLTALARESEVPLPLTLVNEMAEKILPLVAFNHCGEYSLQDFLQAGGLVSLLSALYPHLLPSPTVMGKNIVELAKSGIGKKEKFKLNKPTKKHGALAVLSGNLAREGALFRVSGIKERTLVYSGSAKVFDREEDCVKAILSKKIEPGDIVVLRYVGPKGCPGMPALTAVGKALKEKKLEEDVAIVSDGRLSLSGKTPGILHLSPEAAAGSPLSVVQDGDTISWDFYKKTISLRVTDTEIKVRLSRWKAQEKNMKNSFLYRYCKYAAPSSQGAALV